MNKWGKGSLEMINKEGLHPQLKKFLIFAESYLPNCTITETTRTTEKQQQYFKEGNSQLDGVNKFSFHQVTPTRPCQAFDIVPYPSKWGATIKEWIGLHVSLEVALYEFNKTEKVKLRLKWGGYFGTKGMKLGWDLPHYEIV